MKKIFLFLGLLITSQLSQSQIANLQSRGVGGGGALFFPKINPANDDEFYIACDMSELFHSTDFGQSYSHLHFDKLPVTNTSTYEFTNDSLIAYSNYNDGNDGYPVKTIDGGTTWNTMPGHNALAGPVYKMAANYSNPDQLIINHYRDISISNDGGNTFQTIQNAINNAVGIILCGTFFDGNNIYIATSEGMMYSSDGGQSFNPFNFTGIPSNQAFWHFSAAKTGANTRFVCITADVNALYNGLNPWEYYNLAEGVYTMDNTSGTWTSNSTGINFSNDFVMYTGMAENDIQTIYLGGNDNLYGAPLVYKSNDGGQSWNKIFLSENNQNINTGWSGYQGDKNWSWGETCFGIAVAPNNSNKIIFGDFGFVHTSSNGGTTWNQAYVNQTDQHPAGSATPKQQNYHSIGLENTTAWQMHFQNANTMLAAFSDIGMIRSTDAGLTWGFTYTGMAVNSVYRIKSNSAGRIFAATSGIHDMYQSTRLADGQLDANDANGQIFTSNDNGATWSSIHTFNHPVFWLDIDPTNLNRMYCSVIHYGGGGAGMQGGIWKTDDLNSLITSTWTQLPAAARTEGHPASLKVLNDGKVLCTFSGRRNSSGQFTASSGVFLYNPASNSWSDLSDPDMQYWTKDIVVDPNDPTQNTWYVCVFSGWGGAANGKGGLYRTLNRGQNWTKLTGTQFDRVTSLTFHPQNINEVYLTTETQGLWHSADLSATTPSWNSVHEYDFRQPERAFFNPFVNNEIWISSFGNGIKTGSAPVTGINEALGQNSLLKIYPNPCTDKLTVQTDIKLNAKTPVSVYDNMGRRVYVSEMINSHTTIDTKSLSSGIYFLILGDYTKRFIKN